MRREAKRHLDRHRREEGTILRIRFHFETGIRQKSFNADDPMEVRILFERI